MEEKRNKIRVAVLTNCYESSTSELKVIDSFDSSPAYFMSEEDSPYTFETILIRKASSYRDIRSLVHSKKFDVFFNVCDGAMDEDCAGEDIVRALEELNVPFTGVDLDHYGRSKPDMKMIAYYNNVKTPNFFLVHDVPSEEELRQLTSGLKYPLIVKHPQSHDSMGMTRTSKCRTLGDLTQELSAFVKKYNCALVEEFIVGDEVTVLAVATPNGTKVLPPVRINFQPGEDFKHFDLKWKDYEEGMRWVLVPDDDPARAEIDRVGKVAFEAILGGVGYGRSDLRIDRTTNEVYFLEINPNAGVLFPPGSEGGADWILRFNQEFTHRDFIKALIDTAFLTHKKRQPLYKVTFDPTKGYDLIAACPIEKGSVVFADEGKPFSITTGSSDAHVHVIWEGNHKKLRPLTHSCEPNLVFAAPHSLNCIAARDIQRSEQLTIDFATFRDVTMKQFDCHCGTPSCRGRISATEVKSTCTV